ncbi:hypothetical protein L1049_023640 [Liquidambar formosana]|uniref:DDE Tnp4 domain-containing protein n=1 Tax=Liquidambar formosana TaxID=63359 RepID=A0AAP0WYY0_LIQFO
MDTEVSWEGDWEGTLEEEGEGNAGAIDGTHIRVKVPAIDVPRYQGRKNFPTQNVLAACSFDMKFIYILPGWEGTALNSRVLKNALTRADKLHIPRKTQLFEAKNEVWKELIQANSVAATWRHTKICNYDKLLDLFAKDRAIGEGAISAREKVR